MNNVDEYVDQSFALYVRAAAELQSVPIEKKEYRDLLFTAVHALRECPDAQGEHPYIFLKVSDLYMKAKKLGDNLEISYMDKETFNLTVKFKEAQQCPTKNKS